MGQKAWNSKQKQSLMLYNGAFVPRNKWTRSSNEKYTFPMSIKLLSFYHFIQRELKWADAALQIINFVKSLHSEHFNIKTQFWRDLTWKKTTEWENSAAEPKWDENVLIRDNFCQLVIWKLNCLALKSSRLVQKSRYILLSICQKVQCDIFRY